jgi:hypothetical protein
MYISDIIFWIFSAYVVLVSIFMLVFAYKVGQKGG